MKIFFVEHNIIPFKQFKEMANKESLEYDFIPCRDAEDTLNIARKKHPDFVIMDIEQPGIDSLIALKILKKGDPNIYFFMTSAPQQSMRLKKAITLGADDYLLKPFDALQFISRIKTAIKAAKESRSKKVFRAAKSELKNSESLQFHNNNWQVWNRKLYETNKKILKKLAAPGKKAGTFIHDLTEQHRMESELQKADKLESIAIFISGIAHDFNNFLANMLANIALAKTYKDDFGKIFEKLENIERATLQAKELVHHLTAFFKGEDTIKKVTNIKELIMNNACFVLSGTKISCDFFFSEDLLPLEIDEVQLGQVINNMLINAVQAMPQGGTIRIKAENIVLETSLKNKRQIPLSKKKYVKISIEDEGPGIPEENLSKIFEPFFSTKPGGSGLGLAISLAIVKKHGGYIDIYSRVGKGTTFLIYLPASDC